MFSSVVYLWCFGLVCLLYDRSGVFQLQLVPICSMASIVFIVKPLTKWSATFGLFNLTFPLSQLFWRCLINFIYLRERFQNKRYLALSGFPPHPFFTHAPPRLLTLCTFCLSVWVSAVALWKTRHSIMGNLTHPPRLTLSQRFLLWDLRLDRWLHFVTVGCVWWWRRCWS